MADQNLILDIEMAALGLPRKSSKEHLGTNFYIIP